MDNLTIHVHPQAKDPPLAQYDAAREHKSNISECRYMW